MCRFIIIIASICLLGPTALRLEGQIIKMATLAPDGSSWHELLVEMGRRWEQETDGQVILRVYPGGVVGDERDMIRKIRIGQIHAAAVSIEGLSEITRNINMFYIPLLWDSLEELQAVRRELYPYWETDFEKNGFKLLSWTNLGWIYLFSKTRVLTPDELKTKRIFAWAGNYTTLGLWKKAGFHSVPLALEDVLSSLQTGMIDAFPSAPLAALYYQWFPLAPHMLDLKWAPIAGAIIISNETWESLPRDFRPTLLRIATEMELQAEQIALQEEQAIDVMVAHGLVVHPLSGENKKAWIDFTRSFYPRIRGTLLPEEVFDRAVQLKKELGERNHNRDAAPESRSQSRSPCTGLTIWEGRRSG